jgi:hypothetical protein
MGERMPNPVRLPEIVCRHDFLAPRIDNSEHLLGLVRRIAGKDRSALAELHAALSPTLIVFARSREWDPVEAAAIISATFTEVWWMARFHTFPGTDVLAWTMDIAMRRAADRRDGGDGFAYDQHVDSTLSALLRRPAHR